MPLKTDVSRFLTDRLDLFRDQAETAGVSLELAGTPAETVSLDAVLVAQMMDNLILNALQNTPAGGRVTVAAVRRRDTLMLSVADTGRGVPESLRPHLFEPFASARPEGTGLGLALVREAAEAHGGEVRALHRRDGTTIEIELPGTWPSS